MQKTIKKISIMKLYSTLIIMLISLTMATACKKETKEASTNVTVAQQTPDIKSIAIGIEGMTCQIGCARTIESKLSKTEGVQKVSVSFEDKLGNVVFDANKVSQEEIVAKITGIGNQGTYKVTSISEVSEAKPCCNTSKEKACKEKNPDNCTLADCPQRAAAKADCKAKCDAKKATQTKSCCATSKEKVCEKKCSEECTVADCPKCDIAKAECKTKCDAKKIDKAA